VARWIRKQLGNIIGGFAKAHAFVLDGLIYLVETGVLLAKSFIKGCVLILSMGGCLVFFLLIGPLGRWLFLHPGLLTFVFILVLFPLLGAASIPWLKYFRQVSVQYLVNLSRFLQNPEQYAYRPWSYFKRAYQKAQDEAERRERAWREQQQRAWEERFRQWQQQDRTWQTGGQPLRNPYDDFKQKYEASCAVLDLPVTTDPNKIKLAYRKKAKTHHPDINKAPDATRRFQEINEAYAFLNEDNIRRYQNIMRAVP
jgi:hypothetical protein